VQAAARTALGAERFLAMSAPSDNNTRRMELLHAAARLFRDMGYEKTTVRDLGNAVGIQSGSLFYHFRSKEEILVAVMALGISRTTDHLQAALDQSDTLQEKLAALFHVHLNSLLGENQAAIEVMLYEWRSVSAEARPGLIVLRDRYEQLWQQVLDQAAQAGLVKQDSGLLRRTLLGSLHWTVQWYDPQGPLGVDELAEHMLALVLQEAPAAAAQPGADD